MAEIMLQVGQRVVYGNRDETRPAWVGEITRVYNDPVNTTPMYRVRFDDGSEGVTSELMLEVTDVEKAPQSYSVIKPSAISHCGDVLLESD